MFESMAIARRVSASRRMRILVASLVFIAAGASVTAIALWKFQAKRPDVSPQFRWDTYLPPRAVGEPVDWPAVIARGPDRAFAVVRERIAANTITSNDIAGFRAVINDPDTLSRIEVQLTQLDGPLHDHAVREIYALLMRAESNPDVLHAYLNRHAKKLFRLVEDEPEDNGRWFGWGLTALCHASLVAYERGGDKRFIELARDILARSLSHRDSEIGRVDELRGRAMHSWGGNRYDPLKRHSTNVTLGGRVSFMLCSFTDIVRQDPQLREQFGESADAFLEAARLCMDDYQSEFTTISDGAMGYYKDIGPNEIEPLNHTAWAGNALILLAQLTGEAKYRTLAEQHARFVRSCMRIDEQGCLIWNYRPSPDDHFGVEEEWVWKARTTSQFILFAHEHGVVFNAEDVDALANTLLTHVFRADGTISARIDGPFVDMQKYADFRGNYLATTSFIALERYRPEVRQRIEDLVATRPDIGGWLRSTHGIVAYAWRLPDARRMDDDSTSADTARHHIKHIREEVEFVFAPLSEQLAD